MPSAAKRPASARPIPLAPPVTTATRSRNSSMPPPVLAADPRPGRSVAQTRAGGPGSA